VLQATIEAFTELDQYLLDELGLSASSAVSARRLRCGAGFAGSHAQTGSSKWGLGTRGSSHQCKESHSQSQ
jgi:hypothetical protein